MASAQDPCANDSAVEAATPVTINTLVKRAAATISRFLRFNRIDTSSARLCGRMSISSVFHRQGTSHRKRETHSSSHFVERVAIRDRVANADIERQIVADLPDQPHEAGDGFRFPELLLVENLSHRPHSPFRGTLDDRANTEIGMVVPAEQGGAAAMDGSP